MKPRESVQEHAQKKRAKGGPDRLEGFFKVLAGKKVDHTLLDESLRFLFGDDDWRAMLGFSGRTQGGSSCVESE